MGESAPKKFNELQVGEKDPSGQIIKRIWAGSSSYVIWETATSGVCYQYEATPAANAFVVGYLVKSNRIARLCNADVRKKYKVNGQVAVALAAGLEGTALAGAGADSCFFISTSTMPARALISSLTLTDLA